MPRTKAHIPAKTGLSMPELEDIREFNVKKPSPGSGDPWGLVTSFTIKDDDGLDIRNAKAVRSMETLPKIVKDENGDDGVWVKLDEFTKGIIDALGLVEGDPA